MDQNRRNNSLELAAGRSASMATHDPMRSCGTTAQTTARSMCAACITFALAKDAYLPRPIYDLSPDGSTALTHDFERMKHRGTDYVGIEDIYKNQYAPSKTGIWKMNMDTGKAELIISLEKMAAIAYPNGRPSTGCLYFFREGWNPSGKRFIAFIKDPENTLSKAFSMTPEGTDVRYLYNKPSHHAWQDDNYIMDLGNHTPPGGGFTSERDTFFSKMTGLEKQRSFSGQQISTAMTAMFPAQAAIGFFPTRIV